MTGADIYNVIALIVIILAIMLCIWLNGQTKKILENIATLKRRSSKRKPLRPARRHHG